MADSAGCLVPATWGGMHVAAAGVTQRLHGDSLPPYQAFNIADHTGDNPNQVLRNRQVFQAALGVPAVQWLQQVHGTRCVHVTAQTVSDTPVADSMWTDQPDVALAVMTADCVPVVLTHQHGDFVAAAHAGWQGLHQGVLASLLAAVPGPAEELIGWIGPAISRSCYEVGEEVWAKFSPTWPNYVYHGPDTSADRNANSDAETKAPKRWLDLPGIAAAQLRELGVTRVEDCGWCTYRDSRFYSHRLATHQAQSGTGRMATYVCLL